jgi:hypothetical protein
MISMTTDFDEFESRIHDLIVKEKECDGLFEEIKSGKGEKSLRYLALRDSCAELRKEIYRSARLAGLTRERIKMEIKEARNQPTTSTNAK